MTVLDANMILRYLLNDNAAMAETAERYIEAGNVSVTIEVMAEVMEMFSENSCSPPAHIISCMRAGSYHRMLSR